MRTCTSLVVALVAIIVISNFTQVFAGKKGVDVVANAVATPVCLQSKTHPAARSALVRISKAMRKDSPIVIDPVLHKDEVTPTVEDVVVAVAL